MNIWNRLISFSIYPKLVATFLIVLTPLYVIGWKMNLSGSSSIKSEISNSMLSRASLYMNMFDTDFDKVIRLLQDYINDDDLQNLAITGQAMSDIDKTQAIVRLKYRLDLLKKSSTYVDNASAFIPALHRTVSSNDNMIADLGEDEFRALSKPTNRYESPFLLWNGDLYISVPYPWQTAGGKLPSFLLTVKISKERLQGELQQFVNAGGGAVLAANQMDWQVIGANGDADVQTLRVLLERMKSPGFLKNTAYFVQLSGKEYLAVTKNSGRLNMTLLMFVPGEKVYGPLNSYRSWLYFLSIVAFGIVLFFPYSIYLIIQQPLKKLLHSFKRIELGDLNQELKYPFKDEFGFLYVKFNSMVKQLNILIHEVSEQKYRARSAELRQLQAQINPHFLYNTYYSLYRMAKREDYDNMILYTKYLGDYFQYITRDGAEEIPLEHEVRHAKTYIDIQSVRFGNRIHAEMEELPAEIASVLVPRLILQPIIENCYNHGLEHKRKDGWIRIRFGQEQNQITISVEDNGEMVTAGRLAEMQAYLDYPETAAESTGMINVHRRIQIKYGFAGGLRLSLGDEKGLKVEMVIPLKQKEVSDV